MVACTVEVEQRESSERTSAQPFSGCYVKRCRYEDVKACVYSWRVRVDLLGAQRGSGLGAEPQGPLHHREGLLVRARSRLLPVVNRQLV